MPPRMKPLSPKQLEALGLIAGGRFYPDLVEEEDGWYARWRAVGAESGWLDYYVRRSAVTPLSADAEDQRHETLHDAWMAALKSRSGLVRWNASECAAFAAELAAWHGGGEDEAAARAEVAFTFRPRESGFEIVCDVPKGRKAMRALGQAAYVFGQLRDLRRDGDGLSVALTVGEAEIFLRSGACQLRDAGYTVKGCDLYASVTAAADIAEAPETVGDGSAFSARLRVRVAGEETTAEEIRFLLEQGSSLVFFRDRWIEVDRAVLKEALRALEKSEKRRLSRSEALGFALGIGRIGRLEIAEAAAHGWLRGLLNQLHGEERFSFGSLSGEIPGFAGVLRDYQKRGVAWLRFLTEHGFGALLADDMGLGKTVQTAAWILAVRPSSPVLIAAPLTLLANWRHELAAFAPELKVYVHQGEMRHLASGFGRAVAAADVVITSYSLLVKDHREISETEWGALILDEAQAVKNPDTQAARAVRALGVRRRIALTGTPVENSAADIWSLEEFLNPGFLGERQAFSDRFLKPMAYDPSGAVAKKLRHALEPFVLRRLKSDRTVAGELGEKREIREYCTLTAAERSAYEAALADYRSSPGRPGDAFALITRLKLICDGIERIERQEGGKFARLVELVESIFDAGESALVFTQYAKVGAALQKALEARFARKVQFLHGGLGATGRAREIEAFNRGRSPSLFVLSLKAGGYGLNLTKASHVIHYDRWWNPAVENQATDRAHRIGQLKTVFVHLLISSGTLEERVDRILREKADRAQALIAGGESFLMKMSSPEFERIVRLDR